MPQDSLPIHKLLTSLIPSGTFSWEAQAPLGHSAMQFSTGMLERHVARVDSADTLSSIDLDIEGGSTAHFDVFVNQLRSHMNSANKKYVP